MSLSDRYNRGGGRLETIDLYLTHVGDQIGRAWFARTGISRSIFTQGLYLFSAFAATEYYTLTHNFMASVIVAGAILSWQGVGQTRGGLIEQIQSEAAGLPKNSLVVMRLIVLAMGWLQVAIAIGGVASLAGGTDFISMDILETFLIGAALVALQGSDYISRTNPITPRGGQLQR